MEFRAIIHHSPLQRPLLILPQQAVLMLGTAEEIRPLVPAAAEQRMALVPLAPALVLLAPMTQKHPLDHLPTLVSYLIMSAMRY